MGKDLTWDTVTADDYIPIYGAMALAEAFILNMDFASADETTRDILYVMLAQATAEAKIRGLIEADFKDLNLPKEKMEEAIYNTCEKVDLDVLKQIERDSFKEWVKTHNVINGGKK